MITATAQSHHNIGLSNTGETLSGLYLEHSFPYLPSGEVCKLKYRGLSQLLMRLPICSNLLTGNKEIIKIHILGFCAGVTDGEAEVKHIIRLIFSMS
jgi:hypothetical protein